MGKIQIPISMIKRAVACLLRNNSRASINDSPDHIVLDAIVIVKKNFFFGVGITATVDLAERIPGMTYAALTTVLVAIKKRELETARKA